MKQFSHSIDQLTLTAQLEIVGQDVLIILSGGNVPHIGTISYSGPEVTFQTFAYPSHSGRLHKDGILAEKFWPSIHSLCPGNAVILSGFHQDYISPQEIQKVVELAEIVSSKVATYLTENPIAPLKAQYQKKTKVV
ncbi:amino acid decarboxylase [Enterococcus cecorum]|uniref:prenylated flavin chaperone LpdD n=1 Tax=Enterococcus cecorum TaxID=44008 RepID=UPI00200B7AC2|nr:amino acid decarboxylase [Enterococcus cecorum]